MSRTKKLVIASMLIALKIILDRIIGIDFSPNQRITFSFIAMVINGALLGPITAGLSGGVADVLGYIIKPTGTYFPGFTLTAVLGGLVYGFFFYKREITLSRIIVSNVIVSIGINLLMNSYWIHLLYGPPYMVSVIGRLPFALVMLGIKVLVQYVLLERIIGEMKKNL